MARIRGQRSRAGLVGWSVCLAVSATWVAAEALGPPAADRALMPPAELAAPPAHLATDPWRPVHFDEEVLGAVSAKAGAVEMELLGGLAIWVEHRKTIRNPSGSIAWIGDVLDHDGGNRSGGGLVVIVARGGLAIGSIRVGGDLYMLAYAGKSPGGEHVHVLHQVDESAPRYREHPPTQVRLDPARLAAAERQARHRAAGQAAQDDGSLHDLMVVYSQRAVDEVGGIVAMENLIDLGVTETNLSYEFSGVDHRLRLVHTALTDYDEGTDLGDPRDLLQNPSDGVMDEVHAVRDQVAADLVKLIADANGCGRAFIMTEISIAFEEFAFSWTNHVCVSPGYTFQHELGHNQSGRHQRTSPDPDSPFPYNFGYTDPTNQFRTIMAAGSSECPDGCPRRLAWSNPGVNDPISGAPMGLPDTDPLPTDMHRALNATAWTVANFRVSGAGIFADGFESGDTSAWHESHDAR